jgi:hypothetical protein
MQISHSFDQFAWIAGHMEEFRKLRSDKREKDAIAWYDGAATKMMGRWSPTITKLYLKTFGKV